MAESELLVVTAPIVAGALAGREAAVIDAVRAAYALHASEKSTLPHSVFLRLPGAGGNRIIALPAQLGGNTPVVGMKWVASFPQNIDHGVERASAVIVLNDLETGQPFAILEGSAISAARTAASVALASQLMTQPGVVNCLGIVGCGRINFEVVRFLHMVHPNLHSLTLYDLAPDRAETFAAKCRRTWPDLVIEKAESIAALADKCRLLTFATNAGVPHVSDAAVFQAESVVLHISLRDRAPEVILASDNVVDDADHVCRENTSVHLAELRSGDRTFIRCTLGDILAGKAKAGNASNRPAIFSPFGLGILDLAVAKFVLDLASSAGECVVVRSFLPSPWTE